MKVAYMKKFGIISILMIITSTFFATPYKVESVEGKVIYQLSPTEWKSIENGQELNSSTVIQTNVNSTLIVSVDGLKFTIKSMQKGSIEKLVELATSKNGIKKGSSLKSSAVASGTNKTSKSVVTASSRASEAKEDFEWDE